MEDVKQLVAELGAVKTALRVLRNRDFGPLRTQLAELHAELYDKEMAIKDSISEQLDIPSSDLTLGRWDCTDSPTDFCVYDSEEDIMHDNCLFCEQPEERK